MAQQSQSRALRRGNLNRISSTKVSKHSTGHAFRTGRFRDNPSCATLAKRGRRQRKIDSPNWALIEGQWVKIKASGSIEGITHDSSDEDRG